MVAQVRARWILAAALIPVLYFLGIGPVTWFHSRGKLSQETWDRFAIIYSPLNPYCESFPHFDDLFQWYRSLWYPAEPPKTRGVVGAPSLPGSGDRGAVRNQRQSRAPLPIAPRLQLRPLPATSSA